MRFQELDTELQNLVIETPHVPVSPRANRQFSTWVLNTTLQLTARDAGVVRAGELWLLQKELSCYLDDQVSWSDSKSTDAAWQEIRVISVEERTDPSFPAAILFFFISGTSSVDVQPVPVWLWKLIFPKMSPKFFSLLAGSGQSNEDKPYHTLSQKALYLLRGEGD